MCQKNLGNPLDSVVLSDATPKSTSLEAEMPSKMLHVEVDREHRSHEPHAKAHPGLDIRLLAQTSSRSKALKVSGDCLNLTLPPADADPLLTFRPP